MRVIILCGIPGSGKTTLANQMLGSFDGPFGLVSADQHMVDEQGYHFDFRRLGAAHGACLREAARLLLDPQCGIELLVVDNTNCAINEPAPYAELALAGGHELRTLVVLCDPKVAVGRQVHGVEPAHVFHRHLQLMADYPRFPPRWNLEVVWND